MYEKATKYYSDIKKNEVMPFAATRRQLEIVILSVSKVSQKEKDKYHMVSFICGILNVTQMNLIYETEA